MRVQKNQNISSSTPIINLSSSNPNENPKIKLPSKFHHQQHFIKKFKTTFFSVQKKQFECKKNIRRAVYLMFQYKQT